MVTYAPPVAMRARGRPPKGDPDSISDAAIFEASLQAFAERGFEGTSMREVARDLGISHNLIPQRLGSKEEVWYAAVNYGFGALLNELLQEINEASPELDKLARLRASVVRFVQANAARPALVRIINQEAVSPGPRLDYLFDNFIEPVRQFGETILRDLKALGAVRTESVALLYFFMTHGAGGAAALPALTERFGATVDPVEAVDVLFDGLTVRPTDA